MKVLIDFFLKRPLLVNLISLMIVAAGAFSIFFLQRETFPNVQFDVITVRALYPGSSPEDVESKITLSLERELKTVDGIEEMDAISLDGASIFFLKVDPDYKVDKVLVDVKNAIDQVTDLPEVVDPPVVKKLEHRAREFLKVALVNGDLFTLRQQAKKLQRIVENVTGVSSVTLGGEGIDEIHIEINYNKMNASEITLQEVVNAVRGRNINLSAGKIETPTIELLIRVVGEFKDKKEIESVVIRSNASGQNVRIKDIAKVTRKINDNSILQRFNGKRAVYLQIKKRFSSDIIRTTDLVKKRVEKFFKNQAGNKIEYFYVDRLSFYVKRRLNILVNNGMWGICFVFACLLLFLNFRASVITSLGAPLAFMTAFACMDMMGISINLISMFGLIIVLGMLVDDSIILSEHFYQLLEEGVKPYPAAWSAAINTIKPITATVLTTMVAFGSLFFMGGIMGKFLWPVPAVVIICLAASLFECFFILPSHLCEFVRIKKSGIKQRRWYDFLLKYYRVILEFTTKRYIITCISFFIMLGIGLAVAKNMKKELFPGDDVRIVTMNLKGKVGDPKARIDSALQRVEKIIISELTDNGLEKLRTFVGKKMGRRNGNREGNHYGSFIMYLTPPDERELSTDEIVTLLTNKAQAVLGDIDFTVEKRQGGPPKGKALEIDLMGNDLDILYRVAQKVKEKLKKIDGVIAPEIDYELGKKQLILQVNEPEASRLGLTTREVALEVRRAFAGDAISVIRGSDEDIDITIQFAKDFKNLLQKENLLRAIYVLNKRGQRIRLDKVVKYYYHTGAFVIRRKNQQRIITVSATLDKKKLTPIEVAGMMEKELQILNREEPAFYYNVGGENQDTKESMLRLAKSGVIALFLIFIILVVMFSSLGQSALIMLTIPLGLTGVIFTFKVLDQAIGFMAFMGVVALIGVVVNDSIVLVSFINKKCKECDSIVEAVIMAAVGRFRAVILTTITTVAGLLPIAHARGGDPFLKPMALSFAWGLLFSTAVTLVFIPCGYIVYSKLSATLRRPRANL